MTVIVSIIPHADDGSIAAVSLDHTLWLYRPVRCDEWHLFTQETAAITGHAR